MAFNFKESLQGLMNKVGARREDGQRPPLSNMPNGSVSGYVPKVEKRKPDAQGQAQGAQGTQGAHPAAAFPGMMPPGFETARMGQYVPPMQQPAQNAVPPQQAWGGPTPPRQPYGSQASSQQMPPPQQPMNGAAPQQPMQATGYQPRHQVPPQGWNQGYTQQQSFNPAAQGPAMPPQQPAQPQPAPQPQQPVPPVQQPPQMPQPQQPGNVTFFPGTVVDEQGNSYAMVLRVAQITGVTSCYRLLEFMQNNETVIVNAEQITDAMEANRCMDMLFGAAYAMNQNFERIAGKMIYLIAPRHVHVLPYESMLHLSQQDIERRWPGSSRAPVQDFRRGAARQDDFAPAFGQRAAVPQQPQYTGFGGFSGFANRR